MSPETPSYVRFSPSPVEKGRPPRPSIGKGEDLIHNLFGAPNIEQQQQQQGGGEITCMLSPPRESVIRMSSVERK